MHLEVLVEEPSAEAALVNLLPKMLGDKASYDVHVFQGKTDLLAQLPHRLRGYHQWLPEDWRIVVLVDRDAADCKKLKSQLEDAARKVGLATKSAPSPTGQFQVVNRLAIEELEAWFFGDTDALRRTYPRIPPTLNKRKGYRHPDAIVGGTWEMLDRLLRRAGYYVGRTPKVEIAQRVSQFMEPDSNSSPSFQAFRDGVLACLS